MTEFRRVLFRSPNGAFTEEDLQASSSVYYHVRHPSGAFIEEDLQESSSVYGHVKHPSGAFIEEGLQGSSSVRYHFKYQVIHLPKKTFKSVFLYTI